MFKRYFHLTSRQRMHFCCDKMSRLSGIYHLLRRFVRLDTYLEILKRDSVRFVGYIKIIFNQKFANLSPLWVSFIAKFSFCSFLKNPIIVWVRKDDLCKQDRRTKRLWLSENKWKNSEEQYWNWYCKILFHPTVLRNMK